MRRPQSQLFRVFVILPLSFAVLLAAAAPAGARQLHPRRMVTKASWYGEAFKNRLTASGARFDPEQLSGAHRSLPLGSLVRVTDMKHGRSVVIRINDRGPYVEGRGIDLSYAAARRLGIVRRGIARVHVEVLSQKGKPPVRVALPAHPGYLIPGALVQ
ncbi:MAG: septal ring lytic transglycosylase RlpA family protein [Deltaproteobacteria bacterium]|nr:septal ring lytic transglycosylase RlpA family protein [Deltaproteobacteria bacterium]